MPNDIENRVIELLGGIEIEPDTAEIITKMGQDAINAVCEIASGAQPGLRQKIRLNAVSLLDQIDQEQARETLALLIRDPSDGVSIRALRAVGRAKLQVAVQTIQSRLFDSRTSPLIAAEAVNSLAAISTADALTALSAYRENRQHLPHRDTTTVKDVLQRLDER